MKRIRIIAPLIVCALVLIIPATASNVAHAAEQGRGQRAPEFGPANGSLVIVGGAMRDPAIRERFLDLAGGPDAPIVIVPTAGGGQEYDEWSSGLQGWKRAGATDLTVLHTKDRAVADSDAFVEPLFLDRLTCLFVSFFRLVLGTRTAVHRDDKRNRDDDGDDGLDCCV